MKSEIERRARSAALPARHAVPTVFDGCDHAHAGGVLGRRDFVALAVTLSVVWPIAARAQQPMPLVGILHSGSPGSYMTRMMSALSQALKENGFTIGQDVAIDLQYAEGHNDRLPAMAEDLVNRHVAVIGAIGGAAPPRAAAAATKTIPIVFISATDPVAMGLVASLNRPGGNVTGVSMVSSTLEAKRLELLHELIPNASTVAILTNPNYPGAKDQAREAQEAAAHLGLKLAAISAGSAHDIDVVLAALMQQGVGALLVAQDPYFVTHSEQLVALAAANAIPVIYSQRDYVDIGGLASYGPNFGDAFRQIGVYVARILKGERPADLPVVQPTRFELVINLKTAKTLGLKVPQTLLVASDEVIE